MGMAIQEPKMTPKPKYHGTIVCSGCHAEFDPKTKWMRVSYHSGTSGSFDAISMLAVDRCPVCGKSH